MGPDRLAELGLTVQEGAAGPEVVLPLQRPVVNPLTRRPVPAVTLAVAEELLIPVDPPELVGLPPLAVDAVSELPALEAQLLAGFDEHVARLQAMAGHARGARAAPRASSRARWRSGPRPRSAGSASRWAATSRESCGSSPSTAPVRCSCTDVGAPFAVPASPRRRVVPGAPLALVGEAAAPGRDVGYGELAERFGPAARVPSTSALELVTDFTVRGERYRFVAARVRGRTFRGLLAGPDGKKWAEHFQLEDFPGVGRRGLARARHLARGDLVDRRGPGVSASLVDRVLAGDVRSASRLMRRIDDEDPAATADLQALFPRTGRAYVLGVTGSPGAGKSTLTDRLVARLRAEGQLGRGPRGGPHQPVQRRGHPG